MGFAMVLQRIFQSFYYLCVSDCQIKNEPLRFQLIRVLMCMAGVVKISKIKIILTLN